MQKGSHNLDLSKIYEKCVSQRWDTAKRFKLCFRCLGGGHRGKSCQRSQSCGRNGCQKSHHVLLHRNDARQVVVKLKSCLSIRSFYTKKCHSPPDASLINTNKLNCGTSLKEGIDQTEESGMQAQDVYTADFSGLPTVPAIVSQWDRRHKVDNATIKQCTEAGIAIELENKAENTVSDRNSMLHRGDETAHWVGEDEHEITHILMEGKYMAKCCRFFKLLRNFSKDSHVFKAEAYFVVADILQTF